MRNIQSRMPLSFFVMAMAIVLLLSSAGDGFAQSGRTVKGTILDAQTQQPLLGASVVVVGTRLGASTNIRGEYEILRVLPGTYTLEVSFIGYKRDSREITVSANRETTANFELAVDVLSLGEVVVTGMGGTQIKEKLGVVIASVKAEALVKSDEANVVAALAGKASNIEVVQSSGDPGASTFIRIRGGNSIDRGSQPLFVIDGVPMDNSRSSGDLATTSGAETANRAADVNAEDIESLEILKGAAASAIYGSRAANGVVLITTKSGKPGKTRISYKFQYGTTEMNNHVKQQRLYGQGSKGNASTTSSFSYGPALNVPWAPWYDSSQEIDETWDHTKNISDGGYLIENNITLSGGTDMTTFFLSAGRYFEEGHWVAGSDYTRNTFRLKGSQVVNEKIKITSNMTYSNTFQNSIQRGDNAAGIGIGTLRQPPNFNPIPWLHPDNGFHRSYRIHNPIVENKVPLFDNPFWVMYEHINESDVDRIQGYIRTDYDPVDWINLSYTLGTDRTSDRQNNIMPPGSKRGSGNGRMRVSEFNRHEIDANLIATIDGDKFLGGMDWIDGTLMLGHNLNRREYDRIWGEGIGFGVSRGFNQLDNTLQSNLNINQYEWQINTESFFAQATFDLYDQLYLTGAMRNDGSSTFGTDKRHWYPKTSAAWDFSKNTKVPSIPYLDFGKVRFAYGVAGTQPGVYTILSGYKTQTEEFGRYIDASLTDSYGGKSGFRSSTNIGNETIKPERTREMEYGIDLAFWDSRVGVEFTYYDQRTTDVIFDVNVAPSRGFFSQQANAATISNKGLELAIDFTSVRLKDFQWDTRLIWSTNENMVVDMSGADWESLGGNGYAYAGHPLGEFRMQTWVRFGHNMMWDIDGDGTRDDIDQVYAGQWNKNDVWVDADGMPTKYDSEVWSGHSPNPAWTGSIRNEFRIFGDFTVSAFIDIVNDRAMNNYGAGQLYRYGTHQDTAVRGEILSMNHWFAHGEKAIGEGAVNGVAIPVEQTQNILQNYVGYAGDRWRFLEDAGYIKLREIALAYNLKANMLKDYGISDITFRISGRNLKTWTDYTGWDPDTNRSQNSSSSRGVDYFNSPQIRAFNFTMRVNF